jgi:hypothetical protein
MITNTSQAKTKRITGMRSRSIATLLCLPLLLLPSCGVNLADQDLTGTWSGTLTGVRGDQGGAVVTDQLVFTLVQVGDAISGSFVTAGGATGELVGAIENNRYVYTVIQGGVCLGSFSGTATISGATGRLEGSYVGSDCAGSLDANFSASRQ